VLDLLARNRAKGEMASFGRGLDNIYRNARRMAVGLLAAAGVGGIGYMIKQQMAAIDTTAKLSDRLGITTEALIGLQHGAKISGVEQATLNKSLEILSRRLGEVKLGTGEAKRALAELGLTADDLVGLNMDDALGRIADQIGKLETQSQKAAVANYLFGRSGQQLLNLFDKGSAGIKEMRQEAEKLGLAFSRLDAAQVEAANDALARSRAVLTGLFRQVTIELAPYIETLADKFTELATSGEGVGSNVVNVFEDMSLAAIHFGGVLQGSSAKFKAFYAGTLEGLARIIEISAKLEKYSPLGATTRLIRRIAGAEDPLDVAGRYRSQAAELMDAAGREAAGTYGQENAVRQFYERLRRAAAARAVTPGGLPGDDKSGGPQWLKDTLALNEMTDAQKKAAKSIYEMMMRARGLTEELAREKEILQFTALASERYAADTQGAEAAIERFKAVLEEGDLKKQLEAESKAREKSAQDEKDMLSARADAYRDIYGQMGKMTKSAYDAQRQALAGLYEDYKKAGVAAEDLNVWQKEKLRVMSIEYMKTSGGMAEGFAAAGMTIRNEIDSWGDKSYRFSMTFRDSIATGLENSMRDFDNWKDHLLNVFEEVYWSAVRIAFIEPAAKGLASGMTKGMSWGIDALFGGGGGSAGTQSIDPNAVNYIAPPGAQHGGEVMRTGLAVIHKGETFSGVGNGGGGVTSFDVHIHNEGQEKLKISRVESYIVSDQRIIDITTKAMQTDVKYRRTVAQAAR